MIQIEETQVKPWPRHLLSIGDLTSEEVTMLVTEAVELKKRRRATRAKPLAGRSIALLFEKPSLRTRASFDVGIHELGGYSFYMGGAEVGLGAREPVSDVARVLSRYVDGVVARVNSHEVLAEFCKYASVPVVNALSDWEHPCQTMADLQTILEHKGGLKGVTVAFIGDGNNVSRSLALGCASVGANFVIASPEGYELDNKSLGLAKKRAARSGASVRSVRGLEEAVKGSDVVYTDVWTSMGQEAERRARLKAFKGYTVDDSVMRIANKGAIFMHDMPAHYGEEVAEGMLEHASSAAYDQAENRLHAQKAVLEFLMGAK
jgi:ornithine carbamoyltransferase